MAGGKGSRVSDREEMEELLVKLRSVGSSKKVASSSSHRQRSFGEAGDGEER